MKTILFVVKVLLILLLALNVFFLLIAHGSGHKIPLKTDWLFGLSSAVVLGVVLFLHRISKNR